MKTRREFNLAMLSAGAATSIALSGCSPPEKHDVVVLGGGLSGLNTALLLSAAGFRVVVLEAAEFAGGRARTIDTVIGPLDVGASQVGNGYARVKRLCSDLGLPLVAENRDLLPFGMHYKGAWIDGDSWSSHPLNECVGDEREIPPMLMGRSLLARYNPLKDLDDWLDPQFADYDISLRKLLTRNKHSEQAIELAAFSTPGISIDDTSVLRMFQEAVRGQYERRFAPAGQTEGSNSPLGEANTRADDGSTAAIYNIVGGCQRLPEAMAEKLGDRVRFGKRVTRVDLRETSATVQCADGSKYSSGFVVSAIPFSMLRGVDITSSMEPIARQAIAGMPYGNTARLYVEVDSPYWEDDGLPASFTTDGPMGMFWAINDRDPGAPQRGMFVLIGPPGQAISAMQSPDEFLLSELSRLRPASKGKIRKIAWKDWAADPLQQGCGFSLGPGQVNGFARDMLTPWQVLHFAGEHTRRADFGMEAALESSERVANEIFARA